jgi:FkbM family methyltransferase
MRIKRPIAFILTSSNHGTMIVNRQDYRMVDQNSGFGVGFQILNTSSFDHEEVDFVMALLIKRRDFFGDGVVAIDCGANIGVHSIEWGRLMTDWGRVIAFEAQEKIYYALAGNIVINNCFNVTAHHCAVGQECGEIGIPEVNYLTPSSFGSLEMRQGESNENIGQNINYQNTNQTRLITIDHLNLKRLDLIKIDVEGMEEEVFQGARETISACKPIIFFEVIKSNKDNLTNYLSTIDYRVIGIGMNMLAIHRDDPVLQRIVVKDSNIHIE